jgi:hypothetical protein
MACYKACDGPMNVYGHERGNVEKGRKEGRKEGRSFRAFHDVSYLTIMVLVKRQAFMRF